MRVFDFGANWQGFSSERLGAERVAAARDSLKTLLRRDSLRGASFLDVGCGSGLFAIAAHQLGAARVTGIDVNPRCVAVSEANCVRLAPTAAIRFLTASVLDEDGMKSLGLFDIVYAWGSLHHTGAMWQAIRNVTQVVSPGGTLALSIYNKHWTSPVWKRVKWFYNQLPSLGQRVMASIFGGIIYSAKFAVTRRNPLVKERGMDFWYDVIDWIGGYPYEYAEPKVVQSYVEEHGFALGRFIPAQVPTGCNEFVFGRSTG
jgi:SAM-dependent methyltransferase